MRVYGAKGEEIHMYDVYSARELNEIKEKFEWIWIDCLEPNAKDFEIILSLVKIE